MAALVGTLNGLVGAVPQQVPHLTATEALRLHTPVPAHRRPHNSSVTTHSRASHGTARGGIAWGGRVHALGAARGDVASLAASKALLHILRGRAVTQGMTNGTAIVALATNTTTFRACVGAVPRNVASFTTVVAHTGTAGTSAGKVADLTTGVALATGAHIAFTLHVPAAQGKHGTVLRNVTHLLAAVALTASSAAGALRAVARQVPRQAAAVAHLRGSTTGEGTVARNVANLAALVTLTPSRATRALRTLARGMSRFPTAVAVSSTGIVRTIARHMAGLSTREARASATATP